MIRLLVVVLSVALGLAVGLGLASAKPRIVSPPMLNGLSLEAGDWDWKDADKGSLKGTVTYAPRASRQPMVVYLVKVDEQNKPTTQGGFEPPSKLVVTQKDAKFAPSFSVLQIGQEVVFKNNEKKEIAHNVYFLGADDIDLGIFEREQSVMHKFTQSGEVSVHCSIHKRMDGKFFVVPTPAYALVMKAGKSFEIKDVPAGRYLLKTWQKQKRFKDITDQVIDIEMDKITSALVAMKR